MEYADALTAFLEKKSTEKALRATDAVVMVDRTRKGRIGDEKVDFLFTVAGNKDIRKQMQKRGFVVAKVDPTKAPAGVKSEQELRVEKMEKEAAEKAKAAQEAAEAEAKEKAEKEAAEKAKAKASNKK